MVLIDDCVDLAEIWISDPNEQPDYNSEKAIRQASRQQPGNCDGGLMADCLGHHRLHIQWNSNCKSVEKTAGKFIYSGSLEGQKFGRKHSKVLARLAGLEPPFVSVAVTFAPATSSWRTNFEVALAAAKSSTGVPSPSLLFGSAPRESKSDHLLIQQDNCSRQWRCASLCG